MKKFFLAILAVSSMVFLLAACSKGPAEKTGKKLDEAVTDAKYKIKDMTTPDGTAEKAGQKIDKALGTTN